MWWGTVKDATGNDTCLRYVSILLSHLPLIPSISYSWPLIMTSVSGDGWETWRTIWTLRGMFCANLLILPYLHAILCQIPWCLGFWEEILLCVGILSYTQQSCPGPIFILSFSIFFPGLSVIVSVYTPATISQLTHPYTCGDLRRQEVGYFHSTLNISP